jgi:hypothetical protein
MGFAPEFVLRFSLSALQKPAFLKGTVQSMREIEDKGRDRVSIE